MANVGYFFHGYAGHQILGDPVFYDISGSRNHAAFGAQLSNANAWANAGYVSTTNPAGSGARDTVIRIPGLNLDYIGGEKLFLWWLGKVTAEGAAASFIGDGLSTTFAGVRVRINADGTPQLNVSSTTTSQFSFSGTAIGDGAQHSFAFVLDGRNRKHAFWTDEVLFNSFFDQYLTFAGGIDIDTRNNNTFNIGATAPAIADNADGLVTQTRAIVILRFGPREEVPGIGQMTALCRELRAAPWRLVEERALR